MTLGLKKQWQIKLFANFPRPFYLCVHFLGLIFLSFYMGLKYDSLWSNWGIICGNKTARCRVKTNLLESGSWKWRKADVYFTQTVDFWESPFLKHKWYLQAKYFLMVFVVSQFCFAPLVWFCQPRIHTYINKHTNFWKPIKTIFKIPIIFVTNASNLHKNNPTVLLHPMY